MDDPGNDHAPGNRGAKGAELGGGLRDHHTQTLGKCTPVPRCDCRCGAASISEAGTAIHAAIGAHS